MTENNRQHPRKKIQIEVELNFSSEESRVVITHDLSEGGLFMQLKDATHYPMGEMVNLRFKNPLANYEDTEKDAIIVRHTDDGMAVAYVEMGDF